MARTPLEPAGEGVPVWAGCEQNTQRVLQPEKGRKTGTTSGLFVCLQGQGREDLPLPEAFIVNSGIKRENILAKWGLSPSFPKICLVFGLACI